MALWDFLFGSSTPEQQVPVARYAPWQEQMMQQLGQQGASGLQGILGAPLDSKAMEDEAMRQYRQQIVPELMTSLTSAPTAGLQRSSAFGSQLGAAGTDLATRLAALRSQVAQQQQGLRASIYGNMLGQGTQPLFDTVYKPAQSSPGLVGTFANAFMPGVGSYLASSLFGTKNNDQNTGYGIGRSSPKADYYGALNDQFARRFRTSPSDLSNSSEAQWLSGFRPENLTGSGI